MWFWSVSWSTKAASMYFWSVSLVYQLSGQFLIFLVDQKKIWSTKKHFGIPKKNFGIPKRNLVDQKRNLVDQKNIWYTKKNLVDQKKWEIDWTIGIPKRLTKSTWTPLNSSFFSIFSLGRVNVDDWKVTYLWNLRPNVYYSCQKFCQIFSRLFLPPCRLCSLFLCLVSKLPEFQCPIPCCSC